MKSRAECYITFGWRYLPFFTIGWRGISFNKNIECAKNIQEDVVLIETKAYFDFLGFTKDEYSKLYPVVFYYRELANDIRNRRITKEGCWKGSSYINNTIFDKDFYLDWKFFFAYYGYRLIKQGDYLRVYKEDEEVAFNEIVRKITMGAAARYGTFLYLLHNYMNAVAFRGMLSIFTRG